MARPVRGGYAPIQGAGAPGCFRGWDFENASSVSQFRAIRLAVG